jgi:hypothetical protein
MCNWMPHAVPDVDERNRPRDFWTETLVFELRHDVFGWWSGLDDRNGNGSRTAGAATKPQRRERS